MEPTGSKLGFLLLVLVVLRCRAGAAVPVGNQDDAHSFQCVFNISSNEQQRCMVKVFMGRTPILEYDCYNENVIYEKQEVKTTNVSKHMRDTLKDVGDKMRRRLLDLKTRKICRDSSILQVRLECKRDANGIFSGPWEFLLDEQRFLVFYPEKSGEYKADNPNGEEMKKTWEEEEEMKELLRRISVGDCRTWLQDLDRKKVLGTTAAPATAQAPATPPTVSATPTTAPGTAQSKAMTNRPITSNILVILACLIILWLCSATVTG